MDIYLVGGAVRDKLLGLPVEERDWVVVGATPQQMLDLGYKQVGKDFPVFLHPETKEEYALARTERKTGHGYKGFEFHADPDVTLEEDLQRRDLTINAMAENANGEIIDPYGGQEDLAAGRLRHVSAAFAEDPVRILRVARFASRFGRWGFRVAHGTNALMRKMVDNGEVDYLVPERVWAELQKALTTDTPSRFFTVLHACNALAVLFPEIELAYHDSESSHGSAALPDALETLQRSADQSQDPQVRFATLLLSLGKDLDSAMHITHAEALCERYRIPNDYAQLAVTAIRIAGSLNSDDAEQLLQAMETSGAFRNTQRWEQLLTICRITDYIDAQRAERLDTARHQAAEIGAASLKDAALSGPAIGAAIHDLRRHVIEGVWSQSGSE
jgi:tRNA nucleotidyltransferase (CCA-adding enzyme)